MVYRRFFYDILLTKIIELLILHAFTVATLLQKQWRKRGEEDRMLDWHIFNIPHRSTTFNSYYDEVQALLKSMAGMDEFLQGWFIVLN